MPSFVPRSLEPYQKRELLEKRVNALQAAVRSGAAVRVSEAAERVRAAALTAVKAQRSLIAPPTDPTAAVVRQLANLEREAARWSSLPVEAIVAECAATDAEPGAPADGGGRLTFPDA